MGLNKTPMELGMLRDRGWMTAGVIKTKEQKMLKILNTFLRSKLKPIFYLMRYYQICDFFQKIEIISIIYTYI